VTNIRVNPDMLEWGASEYVHLVKELNSIGSVLHLSTWYGDINSQYAGQLAGLFRSQGATAMAEARHCSHEMSELSLWLRELAKRFEEVDQASLEGIGRLWVLNQAFIAEYGDSPLVPQYLIDGTKPPDFDTRRWLHLPKQDHEDVIQYYRQQWANFLASRTPGSFRPAVYDAGYLEEMFRIYMVGLPASHFNPETGEQTEPYDPEEELYGKPDLPDGRIFYLESTGQRFNMWQYQNLRILTDNDNWAYAHFRLCGIFAAGHAVGVDSMVDAVNQFANVNEDTLINNGYTWNYEIRDLYREMGWEAEQIGRFASTEYSTWINWDEENRLAYPTFNQVEEKLNEGYVITALVGVDSATGYLSSNQEIATGHFVNIIETMETRDGTELVRVYNSMLHREEIYTWENFDDIWRYAGGNSGGQGVIARPSD
jgi:uncharacterized protein YukE